MSGMNGEPVSLYYPVPAPGFYPEVATEDTDATRNTPNLPSACVGEGVIFSQ